MGPTYQLEELRCRVCDIKYDGAEELSVEMIILMITIEYFFKR